MPGHPSQPGSAPLQPVSGQHPTVGSERGIATTSTTSSVEGREGLAAGAAHQARDGQQQAAGEKLGNGGAIGDGLDEDKGGSDSEAGELAGPLTPEEEAVTPEEEARRAAFCALAKLHVELDRSQAAREAGYAVGVYRMVGAEQGMAKADLLVGLPQEVAVWAPLQLLLKPASGQE